VVFAQAVLLVGFLLFLMIFWRYYSFIVASMNTIDSWGAERFLPLRPGKGQARLDAQLYQVWLMVLVAAFVVAIGRIQRLRALSPSRKGGAALALVCTLTAFSTLMCVLPYRITWVARMPRLDVAGERCYRIGESGDDWLIHCPDRQPPRNREVNRTNP